MKYVFDCSKSTIPGFFHIISNFDLILKKCHINDIFNRHIDLNSFKIPQLIFLTFPQKVNFRILQSNILIFILILRNPRIRLINNLHQIFLNLRNDNNLLFEFLHSGFRLDQVTVFMW